MRVKESATSPVLEVIILVLLTVLLAAVLMMLCMGMMNISSPQYEPVPEIVAITGIWHLDSTGKRPASGYPASRVHLVHKGREPKPVMEVRDGVLSYTVKEYEPIFLSDHGAVLYVNGVKKPAFITTLYGHEFIPTPHYGVDTLAGPGIRGYYWEPDEFAWFDFKDGMINEGDEVTIEIIRSADEKIISRSTMTAPVIAR